ncbi:MAG TPA: sulfur carrier protein ThiS [Steroidobacteraceae bacterium]|nr:sulfur carrier protein ThiS [Steroidobacteraceae bacterium]
MKIQVNGDWREVRAAELNGALADLGYGEALVSTAVNGEFVPVAARSSTALRDGDRIEVLAPMQGG